jgi:hypothetical protein
MGDRKAERFLVVYYNRDPGRVKDHNWLCRAQPDVGNFDARFRGTISFRFRHVPNFLCVRNTHRKIQVDCINFSLKYLPGSEFRW